MEEKAGIHQRNRQILYGLNVQQQKKSTPNEITDYILGKCSTLYNLLKWVFHHVAVKRKTTLLIMQ